MLRTGSIRCRFRYSCGYGLRMRLGIVTTVTLSEASREEMSIAQANSDVRCYVIFAEFARRCFLNDQSFEDTAGRAVVHASEHSAVRGAGSSPLGTGRPRGRSGSELSVFNSGSRDCGHHFCGAAHAGDACGREPGDASRRRPEPESLENRLPRDLCIVRGAGAVWIGAAISGLYLPAKRAVLHWRVCAAVLLRSAAAGERGVGSGSLKGLRWLLFRPFGAC